MNTYRKVKRVVDVLIASAAILLVLWWLIPLIGLLIVIDSRGPVFFVQSRDGLDGKPFMCIKFRTMVPNAQAHLVQARENDNRITRIGHILRATYLDELPQFINILLGHMSFIGPRPHMHRDTVHYGLLIPGYMERLKVKPGFTGLAQVMGYTGNTADLRQMKNRIRLDRFYVKHQSAGLDFYIARRSFCEALKKLRTALLGIFEKPERRVNELHGDVYERKAA